MVDTDNCIIGGHQRKKALLQAGYSLDHKIKVLKPSRELTKEEYKRLNIRDNLNHGEWDFEILANEFEIDDLVDWGFDDNLLPDMVAEMVDPEGEEDAEVAPPSIPKTVRGDIYDIGQHRLMCGDSTMIDEVNKLMDGNKVDMVFTDPPYGISIVSNNQIGGGGAFGTGKEAKKSGRYIKANKYSPVIGDETIDVAVSAIGIIKMLGAKVEIIWGGNYYANHLDNSNCWIVWDKETGESTFADAELAWTNQDTKVRVFKHRWSGMVKASEHGQARVHPTQKPIALAEWCFGIYGEGSESVIDLFGGSGSTMVACHKNNRKAFLMELDEKYCDVIVTRMKKLFPDIEIKRNGEVIEWESE